MGLVAVLTTKGYEPVLQALSDPKGTFTVFAPNNQAFAQAKLNVSEVEAITATLLFHNGTGQTLGVTKQGREVRVNGIKVVLADVICSNGIVHIIDRVIRLPQKTSVIAKEARLNILLEAVVRAGL